MFANFQKLPEFVKNIIIFLFMIGFVAFIFYTFPLLLFIKLILEAKKIWYKPENLQPEFSNELAVNRETVAELS